MLRLVVDSTGVTVEVGIGVRRWVAWEHCAGVLRFPDRVELVLADGISVVVRAEDWFRGSEALEYISRCAPPSLLVAVDGEPEPDPTPYRLQGAATSSASVLVAGIVALVGIAATALWAGLSGHRPVAVLISLAFLAPAVHLGRALHRRLAVPRRWRATAVVAGRRYVRLDDTLIRLSPRQLRIATLAAPATGVVAAFVWWLWNGAVATPFIVLGVVLGSAARLEIVRRRGRQPIR